MDYGRLHLRFGWWSLLVFTALGLILETLHGFKVGAYLDVSNESRRLMWTLAHAHGTLLSFVHVLLGLSLRVAPELRGPNQKLITRSLIGASLLLPGGFFLGGVVFYAGDPGLAAPFLVPAGAALLLIAVFVIARMTAAVETAETTARGGAGRAKRERSA